MRPGVFLPSLTHLPSLSFVASVVSTSTLKNSMAELELELVTDEVVQVRMSFALTTTRDLIHLYAGDVQMFVWGPSSVLRRFRRGQARTEDEMLSTSLSRSVWAL